MARASGLALVPRVRDPLRASTRGTGELIAAAIRSGARRVVVGVGGSATTDGGLAALEALGWSFGAVPVTVACDVTTPFLDAATVFASQKGASEAQVSLLTRRLASLAVQYEQRTGVDVRELSGAGAAGGLAGGLAAIGAELEPGFDVVAGAVGLERALEHVDLVVTGEGRLDATSFAGKVVGGVLEWATDASVPRAAVIAGQATPEGREEVALHAGAQLLALTDRVWQSAETFSRTAVLVEEAAFEAAGRVLSEE
jgi:glycerate kinase